MGKLRKEEIIILSLSYRVVEERVKKKKKKSEQKYKYLKFLIKKSGIFHFAVSPAKVYSSNTCYVKTGKLIAKYTMLGNIRIILSDQTNGPPAMLHGWR